MIEQMALLGRQGDELHLYGVTETGGQIYAEAFFCTAPLRQGRVFKAKEQRYRLKRSIADAERLFCVGINLDKAVDLLERL